MGSIAIIHGRVITPRGVIENGALLIENESIRAVGEPNLVKVPEDAQIIDAAGRWVSPGMINGQTHGGIGFDYMTASEEEITSVLRWDASNGITGVLPTLATSSLDNLLEMIRRLKNVAEQRPDGAARILGIHQEGPYLSPAKRGAQPADQIRDPDIREMEQVLKVADGLIRIVTLAPERPGGLEMVRWLSEQGVVPSIGHSEATYEETMKAADAGLKRATHLFNGMSGFDHRAPGAVGAVLVRDEIYAELILDGKHIHPAAAKLALRAKGAGRIVLVTDATQAAGLPDGVYIRPGNRKIIVKDGEARLESGSLAGSVLTLDRAVANAVRFMDISLPEALSLASRVAAESIGLQDRTGSLAPGKDADVIIVDDNMRVDATLILGRVVFKR